MVCKVDLSGFVNSKQIAIKLFK